MTVIYDKKEIKKFIKNLKKAMDNDVTLSKKIIEVGTSQWANPITEIMQKIDCIYFYGWRSSCRPIIINRIDFFNTEGSTSYIIRDKLTHVNVSDFNGDFDLQITNSKVKGLPERIRVKISGQEFCNPLTANHLIEGDEKDIANLLRVTLMSQNFDDGYGGNYSVVNKEQDLAVKCKKTGKYLHKTNSSPIEMLTGYSTNGIYMLDEYQLNSALRRITNLGKDECFCKAKNEDFYDIKSKSTVRGNKKRYSSYYPIYTKKDIEKMNLQVPKDNYDMGVYGLGSAGTAILDQVCRSEWVKSLFMCDFDRVEAKNMINQWYTSNDLDYNKADACQRKVEKLYRCGNCSVKEHKIYTRIFAGKFQESNPECRKYKYVVSGFDSITARQEFLQHIMEGKIEAKYLIDCRYLDLACSIYIIDLENKEEIEFYKANLDADGELIRERALKATLTKEEFVEWAERKNIFRSNCSKHRRETLKEEDWSETGNCKCRTGDMYESCHSVKCVDYLYDLYIKSCPNSDVHVSDASCVKYNYIDIYKYVGAIVFGAIRRIENEDVKPFALVEAETDVNGLPNYMVVRR